MKIVIVGGGTAGWLSALMIKSIQPNHELTVVESSKIGIVGAGEGSTGYLTDIIQGNSWNYGCNEGDFFKETGATVKLGIRHKDWKKVGHEYNAPIDAPPRNGDGTDYILMHAILNDLPFHMASENGYYIENSLSSFNNSQGVLENTKGHAYHFDAHLVGKYFKKICGESVKNIDSQVVGVNVVSSGNIESIILDDNQTIFADMFIDASGFSRILAKSLNISWKSYSKNLPLNTAMPFFIEHGEKIDPVTTAWALKSGWMWMIPTQNRYGCGYVFDDRFTSHEDAKKEVESKLKRSIEPIRFLKFDSGRSEVLWKNNCLLIGLSAAFAEPLEATSIHTTILQLKSFIFEYLRDDIESTCNEGSINIYNRRMSSMYDDMMNFINIHYAGGRSDSEFWKWVSSGEIWTDSTRNLLEMQSHRLIGPYDLNSYFGYAGSSLYNWIMAGLGIIDKSLAKKELDFFGQHQLGSDMWNISQNRMSDINNVIIDNTEFIKNVRHYKYGNNIS
jgi:tryptophan halogenase